MKEIRTVQKIVDCELCTGCGVCGSICPVKAIRIDDAAAPVIDEEKCTNCGLCLRVCPGEGVRPDELQRAADNREATYHPEIGYYRGVYATWATNASIRAGGASGGTTTALLVHWLETRKIDGAVVVRSGRNGNIFLPEAFIARNIKELTSSQQSKYIPAPFDAVIRQILETEGRYAIVGLPCQLAAVRRVMKLRPLLADRIHVLIGLFCGYALTPNVAEVMLAEKGVDRDSVVKFHGWRAHDYPGNFSFDTVDGKNHRIPLARMLNLSQARSGRSRCFLCPDGLARAADIAVGDYCVVHNTAQTTLMTRTSRGEVLVREAAEAGAIEFRDVERNLMLETMTIPCMRRVKTRQAVALIRHFRKTGSHAVPDYGLDDVILQSRDDLNARAQWILLRFITNPRIHRLLLQFPAFAHIVGKICYNRYDTKLFRQLVKHRIIGRKI